MKGKRKEPDSDGNLFLGDGDYGKDPRDGVWYCKPPGSRMGSLRNHEVVEHEDGTITVSPSILVQSHDKPEWHGYLEKGIWRKV